MIDDFINDFPPAGRPAEKIQNFPKLLLLQYSMISRRPGGRREKIQIFPKLLLLQQQQQPAVRPAFFSYYY